MVGLHRCMVAAITLDIREQQEQDLGGGLLVHLTLQHSQGGGRPGASWGDLEMLLVNDCQVQQGALCHYGDALPRCTGAPAHQWMCTGVLVHRRRGPVLGRQPAHVREGAEVLDTGQPVARPSPVSIVGLQYDGS